MDHLKIAATRSSLTESASAEAPPVQFGALDRLNGNAGTSQAKSEESLDIDFSPEQSMTSSQRTRLVAETLKKYMDVLDTAASKKNYGIFGNLARKDGIFGPSDLEAVAQDPNAPEELRWAAQEVLNDPNLYHSLDAADDDGLDDKISTGDLDKVIQAQEDNPSAQSAQEVARSLNKKGSDPDRPELTNFQLLGRPTAVDDKGKPSKYEVSLADLQKAQKDPNLPMAVWVLATQILNNPTAFDALDLGRSEEKDGVIREADLKNVQYSPDVQEKSDEWNRDKDRDLATALNDPNMDDGDLFKGFHQTSKGNCATTAVIKAAMDHFDNQIFESVKQNEDGGYTVKLQDGNTVTVTKEEMTQASAGDQYQGSEPATLAYATLIYAVMAKRAQQMGAENSRTFGEALTALANGEDPKKAAEYLGLKDRMKEVKPNQIKGQDGIVAWNGSHAVYVDTINGQTYTDAWGRQNAYDGTAAGTGEITNAFTFA